MSSDIEQLRREVQEVKDRLAIRECVMRLVRGVDRHDAEVMRSCFHDDAVIKHGNSGTVIRGAEYGEWSNTVHSGAQRFALHSHNITNQNVELDGDVAHAESYVIAAFLAADMKRTSLAFGRYVDRLERREGEWRIAVRRAFVDIAAEGDATYFGNPRGTPVDHGQFWSTADVSYQRPVGLEAVAPQWT